MEPAPPGDPSKTETFRILFGGVVMIRGNVLMGLLPMAPKHNVPHGEITRVPSFDMDVLPFEDSDGIQLELAAPAA